MANLRDFFLQLESSLSAGIPVVRALNNISKEISGWNMNTKVKKMADQIESGMTFSDAMRSVGSPFNEMQISFIKFGEETGTLDAVCKSLAEYADREVTTGRSVVLTMIYPLFVLAIAVIMGPIVKTLIQGNSWVQGLIPAITSLVVFFVVLALIYGLYRLVASSPALSGTLIHIPFLGQIIRKLSLCRFTRTLGIGLAAGVPLNQALETSIKVTSNPWIEGQFSNLVNAINEGDSLAGGIKKVSALPGSMKEMISVGENTGKLPEMLQKVSTMLEDDAQHRMNIISKVLPILVFLPVAAYVGWMIISSASSMYDNILSFGQ